MDGNADHPEEAKPQRLPHPDPRMQGWAQFGLGSGVVFIGEHQHACAFDMRWHPSPPRVLFSGKFETELPADIKDQFLKPSGPIAIQLNGAGDRSEIRVHGIIHSSPLGFNATLKEPVVAGERCPCDEVHFHVVNFPTFSFDGNDLDHPKGKLTLSDALYDIDFLPFPKKSGPGEASKAFEVTHYGTIRRKDGAPIPFDDASAILACLNLFLSFCRGAWVGLALPTGRREDGAITWRDLHLKFVEPRGPELSWFHRKHGEVLPEAFRNFSLRWSDSQWREALKQVIYWYLRSNRSASGVDGNLILTQSALEYLSWFLIAEDGTLLSHAGFEKLSGHDQLRLLLAVARIPATIPKSLSGLSRLGKAQNNPWDGPAALVEIRNDLVHPRQKPWRKRCESVPHAEAWNLGQWYVELTVLGLLRFDGTANDRTKGSQHERTVNWTLGDA